MDSQQPIPQPQQGVGAQIPPEQGDNATHGGVPEGWLPIENKSSLISYYFGVVALIPLLGIVFAIPAVIFGHKALAQERLSTVKGAKAHARFGLICGYLQITLFTIPLLFIIAAAIVGN